MLLSRYRKQSHRHIVYCGIYVHQISLPDQEQFYIYHQYQNSLYNLESNNPELIG
jgi:hypothetical protein